MNSTDPIRKRRFNFHLSTGVILMLAAGGLVWANVQPRFNGMIMVTRGMPPFADLQLDMTVHIGTSLYTQGWPGKCRFYYEFGGQYATWDWKALLIDALVAIGALLLTGFACEYWIRRTKKRVATRGNS